MARVEASKQPRTLLARRNPEEPEPQLAATRVGKRPGRERGIVGCLDHRTRLRQKDLPRGREGHPVMVSTQQLYAELPLQLGDRPRKRWLHEVQLLSGGCHLPFFGDRDEVAQLAQSRHRTRSRRDYLAVHSS